MGRISVIVPTRDRYRDLRRCLLGLADNDLDLLEEVLVVDDGSTPHVSDVVEVPSLPVRVLRNPSPRGAMWSRNLAAETARGAVLAFLDDDAVPRHDWLLVVHRSLRADRGAVTGRVLPFDAGLVSRARQARYDARYSGLRSGDVVDFFAGGNSAVWADTFRGAGGFRSLGVGGDNSLTAGMRERGQSVHFARDLVVVHRNGKGVARAFREALSAGLDHQRPMSPGDALREARTGTSPDGADRAARTLNEALRLVHLAGRGVAGVRGSRPSC